jgi:hypothetical protein
MKKNFRVRNIAKKFKYFLEYFNYTLLNFFKKFKQDLFLIIKILF